MEKSSLSPFPSSVTDHSSLVTKKVLVTGGAGFIGSNFIHFLLKERPGCKVVNLDKLTYAGNLENLSDIDNNEGYQFVKGDIADRKLVSELLAEGIDVIVNFAAESHVDRSILDPFPFIKTNVEGTQVLLEGAKKYGVGLFLQISTDEVYGSLGATGKFTEDSPLLPNSPYAASKASADCLCRAYYHTYKLPVIITRCSNNYGPYQFPEKLIPKAIIRAHRDMKIPIYGTGENIRDWIFIKDHCEAIDLALERGEQGEIYNISSGEERSNLEVVREILRIMDKPDLIEFVEDRPGHDIRYSLDSSKTRSLGWKPKHSFKEGLKETVEWYLKNEWWWQPLADERTLHPTPWKLEW